jgi:hypothetical protein
MSIKPKKDNPMKALTVSFLSLIATATVLSLSAQASENCGQFAGRYNDSTPDGLIIRTITRYASASGFHYVYELDMSGIVPSEIRNDQSYELEVHLNGKDGMIQGQANCTTATAVVVSEDCQAEGNPGAMPTNSGLFTFVANGEKLNAWDLAVRPIDPVTRQPGKPTFERFEPQFFQSLPFSTGP